MIVESTVGIDKVGGSNAFFETSVFAFVACFVVFSTSLTFMFHQLIVTSFWDSVPLVQSIQIWFGRRRRKPPDKNSFPFRDLAFRRLIVAYVSGSKPRGPKESPFDPSAAARTISDSAIEFARRFERLPDSSGPDPATSIPNRIGKSPR